MIIIHFIMLTIFIILFFWTRGMSVKEVSQKKDSALFNAFLRTACFVLSVIPEGRYEDIRKKHRLLSPSTGGKKEAKRYLARKIAEVLMVLFIGNMIGMCVTGADTCKSGMLTEYSLFRNSYGEGDKKETLQAEVGGKKLPEELDISIGERQYGNEEIEKIFDEAEKRLQSEILGENKSLGHVDHDLNLIEEPEDIPVAVSWRPSTYDCIDGDGKIREDFQDINGMSVVLTAELAYYNHRREVKFPVMIYPAVQSSEEALRDILLRKITRIDSETVSEDKLILPDRIGDYGITYRRGTKRTGALILFMTFITGALIYAGRDRDLGEKIRDREKEMLRDYPEILSKMILLFSAGMTIRGSIEKIVRDYEKRFEKTRRSAYAYEELKVTLYEMNSGVPEPTAYENLGNRAGIRHYSRLGSLLSQNLRKGNAGLLSSLEHEAAEAFAERKANARKKGEEAGTKLLLPMGIMLLIVMVIIIVPAFLSFSL